MTIAKDDIISFVNAGMRATFSGTDLDEPIQMTLDDLSQLAVLLLEDTTQALTSSSMYLSYPARALSTERAIKSVRLTDSSSVRCKPLLYLPGGWSEYERYMESFSDSSRGLPTHWVQHASRMYLYPAPDGSYTSSIWYYAAAQAVASGIEFPDDWILAIKYGTIYHKALLRSDAEQVKFWGPMWMEQRERKRLSIPRDTMIQGA
jgi:hypothetical protein